MSETVTVIGVDCATAASRNGLALGRFRDGRVRVEAAARGHDRKAGRAEADPVVETLADWIEASGEAAVLLALDAPLGWPDAMRRGLVDHRAGAALPADREATFRRETDRWIARHFGITPLDVGANLIARAAHATLERLGRLRERTGARIPLAWSPAALPGIGAIEVYPRVTCAAHGLRDATAWPQLDGLDAGAVDASGARNEHVRDALVCLAAGADFLRGDTAAPENAARAEREGWIQVRRRPGGAG